MYKKEIFWIVLWFVLLFVFIVSIGACFVVGFLAVAVITAPLSLALLIVFAVPLIYWELAPLNICWTFVEEGTVKIIVMGGKVVKILIQWKDYTLDENWNVIPEGWHKDGKLLDVINVLDKKTGELEVKKIETDAQGNNVETSELVQGAKKYKEKKHLFGGLRFYGLWPIWDIYGYQFRWTSIREDGVPVQHDDPLDYVMIEDDIYFTKLRNAETEKEEKIPVTIDIVITMRIVNPYKAAFRIQDWLELILNRIKPLFREHVATVTYEELLSETQKVNGELWKKLDEAGLIEEFENDYGVKIKPGGIEMKDITPPPEYQKASTQKYLAEREAEKRSGETMGAVIQMMASVKGVEVDQIQEEIKNDPELEKEFRRFCQDLIHRKMAIEGGSYLDIRVAGAEGMEKSLLELIATWQRMPLGKSSQKEKLEDAKDKIKKS